MTHISRIELWKYLEDVLNEADRDAVDTHLEVCDACVEQLAEVAALDLGDGLGSNEETGWFGPEPVVSIAPWLQLGLEQPADGFVDRVMDAVLESGREELAATKVVPLQARRRSPRLEVFTHFVTAAVVTGFMMLGSYQAAKVEHFPVVGTLQEKVEDVSVESAVLYMNIHVWIDDLSAKLKKL